MKETLKESKLHLIAQEDMVAYTEFYP